MCEEDVQAVMRHPGTMIGSDGLPTLAGKPHPRLFGTFARVLGRYSRELGVLSMADAVHRMTGMPAARFGLEDRGVVRIGAIADLVVFDPATVIDRGTYENPAVSPSGIPHVLVNGTFVVRDAVATDARPGHVLRRRSKH
jgi:N-acyl-D-aspartate/D-glutamate deacylase